ncbi:MAG: hypothetical protein ABJM43_14015 [Paracoccaceae bacterium]
MIAFALIMPLTACSAPEIAAERVSLHNPGIETMQIADNLMNYRVEMPNTLSSMGNADYAQYTAKGYVLIQGWDFARHVCSSVERDKNNWTADAYYTISEELPRGIKTIKAKAVAPAFAERGIPTE